MPTLPATSAVPAIEARARWTDGEQFVATAGSGHGLVLDADRGRNSGPSPMEMVLLGLCACSATDVVMILAKARQPLWGLEVSARGERAPSPPTVYTAIHMRYQARGEGLDRAAVERAVELSHKTYCSVLLMLHKTARITHEILIEP